MARNHTFVRDDVMPSYWANAIQDFIGNAMFGVHPRQASFTTVEVPASDGSPYGAGNGRAALAIQGRWRYNDYTVSRAHPGGAAGVYGLFAVASDEAVDASPQPYSDHTNYAFELRIAPPLSGPATGGGVDIYRKIGEVIWNGSAIEFVRPLRLDGEIAEPFVASPVAGTRILAGTVAVGGTTTRTGWTATRTSAGVYVIAYEPDFVVPPSVQATPWTSGGDWTADVASSGAAGATIHLRLNGVLADNSFEFLAVGA